MRFLHFQDWLSFEKPLEEKSPLYLVTKPVGVATEEYITHLQKTQLVLHTPLMAINPISPIQTPINTASNSLDQAISIEALIQHLSNSDIIVLISPTCILLLNDILQKAMQPWPITQYAVIGAGSLKTLSQFVPLPHIWAPSNPPYDASHFIEEFKTNPPTSWKLKQGRANCHTIASPLSVSIIKGVGGNPLIVEWFTKQAQSLKVISIYSRELCPIPQDIIDSIIAKPSIINHLYWVISSGELAKWWINQLQQRLPPHLENAIKQSSVICTHAKLNKLMHLNGFKNVRTAHEHN